MTTLQGILFAIIEGFTTFFPVDTTAHHRLLSVWLEAPFPSGVFLGSLTLAVSLSLWVHLRHDLASLMSGTLTVLLTWKRPMTIDERVGFFLILAAAPVIGAFGFIKEFVEPWHLEPLAEMLGGIGFAFLLWLSNLRSKKNKRFVDWAWPDALFIGVLFPLALLPGANHFSVLLTLSLLRNFSNDGALKFIFLLMASLFLGRSLMLLNSLDFHAAEPALGMSWMTLGVSFLVCGFCSLLAIDTLSRNAQKSLAATSVTGAIAYRFLVVLLIGFTWWMKGV